MGVLSDIVDFAGAGRLIALCSVVAFGSGAFLGWHEESLRIPAKTEAQQKVDAKACAEAQAKTKGENDAIAKDRDRIAADLARYKRMHPDACVHLTNSGQLRADRDKHAGVYGISTDWLRDYAALCETYRSEVIVCTGQ